jgi:dihydroorotate dehydrogenase (NAD+) catalytic subunit
MITLSNGCKLLYLTASGAMGYNGRGWLHEQLFRLLGLLDVRLFIHRAKTITLPPREGNFRWYKPWDCVRPIWADGRIVGTVNAYGLTNPGLDWFLSFIAPYLRDKSIPLIASIFSDSKDSPKELGIMASRLGKLGFVAIEYNTSCPNTGHGVEKNVETVVKGVDAIEQNCDLPIGLKLSVAQDVDSIVCEVKHKVQYLDINSVPWHMIFPGIKSPLEKFGGGGVSGKIAQRLTWALGKRLKSISDVPVIWPSIWDDKDVAIAREMGADAESYGSVCLCKPQFPTSSVRRDRKNEICAS